MFALWISSHLALCASLGCSQSRLPIERLALEPTRFGTTVDGAGDADLDGFADVILGASYDRSKKGHYGRAVLYSGKTGEIIYEVYGDDESSLFGIAVAGAGDTNADGTADFVVGAPLQKVKKVSCGSVRVYSGRSGKVQLRIDGKEGEYFGWSVRGVGDANQDGFADLVVGAPMASGPKKNDGPMGCVRLYSGKKGKLLLEWFGEAEGDLFGSCVDGAGDVNGDGSDDIIVTAWGGEYVRVFSGHNGKLLYEYRGEPGDGCGWIARRAGDTNQNGMSEVVLGFTSGDPLAAAVVSPKKDATLWTVDRPLGKGAVGWSFATALDGTGDVNADGFRDIVIGDPGIPMELSDPAGGNLGQIVGRVRASLARPGRVIVLSGRHHKVLRHFEGTEPDDFFGVSVAGAGDCNSDGTADILIGAGENAPFHAQLYSGRDGKLLHTFHIEME